MNIQALSFGNNLNVRRNHFIKYSNSFMSMNSNSNEAVEKAQSANPSFGNKVDKTMGIETLTIFPKQVVDGRTIFTA